MIAYSLGNFAGPNTLSAGGDLSLSAILRVHLTSEGDVLGGQWIPLRLVRPGLPRPDPAHASTSLVRRLSRQDFAHGFSIMGNGTIGRDPALRR